MRHADDIEASELEWRTAAAVAEEHRWLASTLVARVLSAGDYGLSIADWCEECADDELGADPYHPFGLLWAVRDAAARTGLELPWELELHAGALRVALIDRDAAARLLEATHHLPQLDRFIDEVTGG